MWQVQTQVKSKHAVPFVRIEFSKDWVRGSPRASQPLQALDGFHVPVDRVGKNLDLRLISHRSRHDILLWVKRCWATQSLAPSQLDHGGGDASVNNGIMFQDHKERPPSHVSIDTPHGWDFNATLPGFVRYSIGKFSISPQELFTLLQRFCSPRESEKRPDYSFDEGIAHFIYAERYRNGGAGEKLQIQSDSLLGVAISDLLSSLVC